jgi:hypothetical protein
MNGDSEGARMNANHSAKVEGLRSARRSRPRRGHRGVLNVHALVSNTSEPVFCARPSSRSNKYAFPDAAHIVRSKRARVFRGT